MKPINEIRSVKFEGDFLVLVIDNVEVNVDLRTVSPKLAEATENVRNDFEVSPSGYGIHWKQLDEDLSVNGLIKSH